MALIRNIAGIGNVVDVDTMLCNDYGCTDTAMSPGGGGGTGVTYEPANGSGVFDPVIPQDPIIRSVDMVTDTTEAPVPSTNVVAVQTLTPEPPQQKTDAVSLLILAAMAVVLSTKPGNLKAGLYLGGVGALYYHLKK